MKSGHVYSSNVFESICDFHCFIMEHMDWFKSVMKFSMDTFDESLVAFFEPKTVNSIVQLAAVGGMVPLQRVDMLCSVTKNDKTIDWRLIRAMAMIDLVDGRTEQEKLRERGILVKLYNIFLESEAEGITSLFKDAPYHFIKYFFFELFSGDNGGKEDIIEVVSILAKKADLHALLNNHEGLQCGIAFFLCKALSMIFRQEEPEKGNLFKPLTEFISAGLPHYVLTFHCMFDVIYADDILANLDEKFVKTFEAKTPLFHFIRMNLVISILIETMELSPEKAITYYKLIQQLSQDDQDDIREMNLFVLQKLSSGGTVDIE